MNLGIWGGVLWRIVHKELFKMFRDGTNIVFLFFFFIIQRQPG